jgi:hypothetical protein
MNLKSLADKAKDMFNKRGGTEAAKEDFNELKDIAGSKESLGDKAKDAAEALKDPGAPGAASSPGGAAGPTAPGTGGPAPSTTPTEPTTADEPPPADAPPRDPAAGA